MMRLLIIGGPTASGKSRLAMELALALNAEIISADSVQVYKGLDIGSAKPSYADRAKVRHHLIDVLEPGQTMDAGQFVSMAEAAMADITQRGKNIIVAGGTGLYIKALLLGLAQMPTICPVVRDELKQKLEDEGLAGLYQQLQQLDPLSAQRIKPNDKQRILRALEVVRQTGKPLSYYQRQHDKSPRYPYLLWGVERPRAELRQLIAQRAEQMWQGGLLDEVARLLAQGVPWDAPGLRSLGYRQAVAVLQGQNSEVNALSEMIRLTQAYSKRQVTWFKNMPGIKWVGADAPILAESRDFLRQA